MAVLGELVCTPEGLVEMFQRPIIAGQDGLLASFPLLQMRVSRISDAKRDAGSPAGASACAVGAVAGGAGERNGSNGRKPRTGKDK